MGDQQKKDNPNPSLEFLVKYSSKLADIQRKLKNKQNSDVNYYDDLHDVKESIKKSNQIDEFDPDAVQELLNVVQNILNQHKKSESGKDKALFDEFTKLLSNDRYNKTRKKLLESPPHDKNSVPTCPSDPNAAQELLNKVENILNQHKKSESGKDIALLHEFTELLSNDRYKETRKKLLESSPDDKNSVPICPFDTEKQEILDKAYDELEDVEKKCLIFSFTLFNNVDLNVEVRKRELIHWWMGMEYVSDYYTGEKVLEKLSQRHFIVKKRKFRIRSGRDNMAGRSTRYNMEDKTLKCLLKLIEERMCDCIRDVNRDLKETSVVINMSAYIFNKDILDKLSKEKAKILHLGSWNSSMDYLVLEDDQGLFSLKITQHTKEVNVLSIQGISRIKTLSPDLLSNLTNLKVLDLRSCQDLENLPNLQLKNLICLDLSECYQLKPINIESNSCPQLQVLKGFIIPIDGSGFISKLSVLKRLVKLTIYNKNKNFPTDHDVEDLCSLEQLRKLKVVWVLADTDQTKQDTDQTKEQEKPNDYSLSQNNFPKKLEKLELESAPMKIAAELLRVISEMKDNCCLQKLYIRGGTLSDLDHIKLCFPCINIVNLRYLPNLKLKWDDFLRLFPNLSYLEVLLCPKLEHFPCDDIKTWNNSNPN